MNIDAIQWQLTSRTAETLLAESPKLALRNAIQKAKDYGEELEKAPIAVDIKDVGSRSRKMSQAPSVVQSDESGYQNASEPLNLHPEDLEVNARIEVRYEAE